MKTENVTWMITLIILLASPVVIFSQEIVPLVNKFQIEVKIKGSGDSISSVSEEEIKKQVDEAVDKEKEKIKNKLEQEINKWKKKNERFSNLIKTMLLDNLDTRITQTKAILGAKIKHAKEQGFDGYTAYDTWAIVGGIAEEGVVVKAVLKAIFIIVRILPETPTKATASHEEGHVGLKTKLSEFLEGFIFPEGIKGFTSTEKEADDRGMKLFGDWRAILDAAEAALNEISGHGETIQGAGIAQELEKVIEDLIKKKFEEGKDMQKALTETKTIVEGLKTKEDLDELKKSLKKE